MDDYRLDALDALGDELFARVGARDARGDPRGSRRHLSLRDATPTASTSRSTSRGAHRRRATRSPPTTPAPRPQQPRAINCVLAYTYAMTAYAISARSCPGWPTTRACTARCGHRARGLAPEPALPRRGGEPRQHRPLRAGAGLRRAPPGHPRSGDGGRRLAALGRARRPGSAPTAGPTRTSSSSTAAWARRRQGRRERALLAEQHLVDAGGGGRAQQPALLPLQAAARRARAAAGVSAAGSARTSLFECESDAPIVAELHGRAHAVPAPGLAGGRPGGLGDVQING